MATCGAKCSRNEQSVIIKENEECDRTMIGLTDVRKRDTDQPSQTSRPKLHVIITESGMRKTKDHKTDTDCPWMKALQLLLIVQQHH